MSQEIPEQLLQRAKDLAAWATPPWYHPVQRWKWKRYGAIISANKFRAAVGMELLPLKRTGRKP